MHASRYISADIYIADTVGTLLGYSGISFIYLMQAAVGAAINGSSPQPSLEDCSWIIMGNESIKRNGVAPIVNKSPKCSTWVQSQK